ncbi:enoyl-CoA hydratase/isomerase family protein [Streptomyces gobiensis]|uniref:enoyl-CoA hydratase/isomerase family protein n=1 Tax=Streptomyces gobiensis TaxID=2875706 RepID=UPI001E6130C4|nr:enoyl-CoA hydratase-related protein [Streptomyces gobiensis]UGY94130.1 enoyl-CoA hydratase/isomerase family protein [Streptomyces gobiensis]
MTDVLHRELRDGVATLTLNRPGQRNALDRELSEQLLAALVRAAADPAVRCVVITGSGGAFCAGDDLAAVSEFLDGVRTNTPADAVTGDGHYLRICEAIVTCPKPVIAGIDGAAAGAGTEIACAADYRLASDRAKIGSCLVQVGHLGNAVMLPRVVGPARATEMFLTGRLVGAAEAERTGLVHQVVPAERFSAELSGLAARLASGPTKSIGYYKELREAAWGQPVLYGLRLQDIFHVRSHTEIKDASEGPRAFLEGRPPQFAGH